MICCCCFGQPAPEQDPTQPEARQHLIPHRSSRPATTMHPPRKDTDLEIPTSPLKLQDRTFHEQPHSIIRKETASSANEERSSLKKRSRVGSIQQTDRNKRKSEIWVEEMGTRMVYSNSRVEEEMVLLFEVLRGQTEENNPINYVLAAGQGRGREVEMVLVVTSRGLAELEALRKFICFGEGVKPVFAIYRQEEWSPRTKGEERDENLESIMMGRNSVRVNCFERIVISAITQRNIEEMLRFVEQVSEQYSLQQLVRCELMLPNWTSLSEISLLLNRLYRKFVIGSQLGEMGRYLNFTVELLESSNFESIAVIRNRLQQTPQSQTSQLQFSMLAQLAGNLLPIVPDHSNFPLHCKLMRTFLLHSNIPQYLQLAHYLRDRKLLQSNLEKLKIFQGAELLEIQNSMQLEHRVVNEQERFLIFPARGRRKMEELLAEFGRGGEGERRSGQQREWDDDLEGKDIRVAVLSCRESGGVELPNILENLEASYIDPSYYNGSERPKSIDRQSNA